MRTAFCLTILLLCSFLLPAGAASFPKAPVVPLSDTTFTKAILQLSPKTIEKATGKKLHWYQKWQLKLLQKKLSKHPQGEEYPVSNSIKALSVIALVAGALSIILLIAGSGLSLLLCLAGLITGIIALGGNRNRHNKHRTMAILGVVLSGLLVLLVLVALLAWTGDWWG